MLLLTATTDKLQLITGQAVTVDVHATFDDFSNANPPVLQGDTSGRLNTAITTATTTDIVAAPASGDIRNIKTLCIRNKHASTSVDVTVQFNQNATLFELRKVTLIAGATLFYSDATGFVELGNTSAAQTLMKILAADAAAAADVNTAQPWFPTAGGVTITANTTYLMEGELETSRAAGTTSHTTGLLFGGTATVASIQYTADTNTGDVVTTVNDARTLSRVATNTTIKAASTAATEQMSVVVRGVVRFTTAGTFIPQFIYSTAPGGIPTIKANSYFKLTPIGDNNFASQGAWA